MPIQAPQWTEFLSCPICYHMFDEVSHRPISLACGHTVCKSCLNQLPAKKKCPFDQTLITRSVDELPVNFALLQLVGVAVPDDQPDPEADLVEHMEHYTAAKKCIEDLAIFLKPLPQVSAASSSASSLSGPPSFLSRPMQRKLVTLVNCQLIEEEGRSRAVKAARSLGERTVTELILLHQNPQQLSANLWAGVRARGCQFLGPAMQEEVLRLILLALEDGSALSRKVLVLFVVQRLESQYPQASKTAIGHVVQLLYRASCFKVTKREEESSLMQLKDEFRTYEALRREHDSQIVQIATEAGLRISPEQWSSLLYGDTSHKSHMQSIIDKLQSPQSFGQSITELTLALTRTGDPGNLFALRPHLELLANVDPNADNPWESWLHLHQILEAVLGVVRGFMHFTTLRSHKAMHEHMPAQAPMPRPTNAKYKTSMCRDLTLRGQCPRSSNCTFAHSHEEMEKYRARSKKLQQQQPGGHMDALPASMPLPRGTYASTRAAGVSSQVSMGSKLSPSPESSRGMSVSMSSMKSSTQTSSQPNKPIMSISTEPGHNVVIPIARPSPLPGSTKQFILKESIYSSPTLVETLDNGPNIMPISQRVPSVKKRGQNRERGMKSHQNEGDAFMRSTMTLPPNPYTSPPQPTTQPIKTPMKQLGELHRRRDELLSRLKPQPPQPQTSPPITSPPPSASPQLDVAVTVGSVADSMASTHCTMSLADCHRDSTPANPFVFTSQCAPLVGSGDSSMSQHSSLFSDNDLAELERMIIQEEHASLLCDQGDEFVPFEHTTVSKYGPISRGRAKEKLRIVPPVNVTAGQKIREMIPVMAVTPNQHQSCQLTSPWPPASSPPQGGGQPIPPRQGGQGYPPIAGQGGHQQSHPMMSSMEGQQGQPSIASMGGHFGIAVASSLPTALMKPHVIAAANIDPLSSTDAGQPHTLWALREKMLSMSDRGAVSQTEQNKIHADLCCVSQKIKNLQASEEERMTRELQAIELNIKETQRRVTNREQQDFLLAREEQRAEVAREQEKVVQEAQDMHLAQKLALQEAQEVIRANNT